MADIIVDLKPKSDLEKYKADLEKEKAIIEKIELSINELTEKGQKLHFKLQKEVADLEAKAREVAQQAYSEYISKRVKDDEEALKKINIKMEKKQTQIQEAHERKNKIQIIFNYLDSKKIIHA